MRAELLKVDEKQLQIWRLDNNKLIVVEPKESGVPDAEVGQLGEARCSTKGIHHGWHIIGEYNEGT
jgi:hypothetical protein